MGRETTRAFERFRRDAGPIENNLVDELVAGDLDREEFLRRAALFGVGAGIAGVLLRYVGDSGPAAGAPTVSEQKRGGTLRIGITRPDATVEPSRLDAVGGVALVSIVGEYLTFCDPQGRLHPWLATGWKPSNDAAVWTFELRRGVRFHDGQTLTADDVVSSLRVAAARHSTAAPVFDGVLAPQGVRKTGRYTVQFRLEGPVGNFPYLVSQTTYQAPILPAAYRPDTFVTARMPGTGPYKLETYTEGRSAIFVRNPAYWGRAAAFDAVRVSMFPSSSPQVVALRAGQLDLVQQVSAADAAQLAADSRFRVLTAETASHREFALRTDREKFRDPRVRRAIALTLNRPGIVRSLWRGRGAVGNDSPFSPVYRSTSREVGQRVRNMRLARELLEAAGDEDLRFTLTTWKSMELPRYAAIIRSSAEQAGIGVELEVLSRNEYYGARGGHAYVSTAPWLNREATITDFAHRAIPNVYLSAAFRTGGKWNASKYSSKAFDAALASYVSATDLATQRKYARQMQTLLLQDTPVIVAYFHDWIAVASAKLKGYSPDALGALGLRRAWVES